MKWKQMLQDVVIISAGLLAREHFSNEENKQAKDVAGVATGMYIGKRLFDANNQKSSTHFRDKIMKEKEQGKRNQPDVRLP